MPQKDKCKRQEYNKQQYLKRKTLPNEKIKNDEINFIFNDNYYLLKFYKNIQKVNEQFIIVKFKKPVVYKFKVNLKEAIINELKNYQE